ncbi:hypothetical protein NB311A_07003 [Nitrobacter sp. Nb-311A]|nr:hypothetical protein NB311A_07003 [Nitrobacter sp. Nb-311A]
MADRRAFGVRLPAFERSIDDFGGFA